MSNKPKIELDKYYQKEVREVAKKIEKIELNSDAEQDYDEIRAFIKNIMMKSGEALDSLLELAHESEHPRTYEVLATLLKTSGDLGTQLIDLQKKRHELDVMNNPEKSAKKEGTNNTAIFVGSTTELQKLLKNENEKDVIDIDTE